MEIHGEERGRRICKRAEDPFQRLTSEKSAALSEHPLGNKRGTRENYRNIDTPELGEEAEATGTWAHFGVGLKHQDQENTLSNRSRQEERGLA